MGERIDWSELRGIHRSETTPMNKKTAKNDAPSLKYKDNYFEELAVAYLNDHGPHGNEWNRTADLEAGHDGYLYIYSNGKQIEWWMEAKYSSSPKHLQRGRIDATIAKILLSQHIERLFIVTNCEISAKTKAEIKHLVRIDDDCRQVKFITKSVLELWLLHSSEHYTNFFDSQKLHHTLELARDYFCIHDVELYEISDALRLARGQTQCIYHNRKYYAYFSVFCASDAEAKVQSDYFDILSKNDPIHVKVGVNDLRICVMVKPKLPKKAAPIIRLCSEKFIIKCNGDMHIRLMKSEETALTCAQDLCYKQIANIPDEAGHQRFRLYMIEGDENSGKSYLMQKIMHSMKSNSLIEFESFKKDPYANAKNIYRTLLYLFFPYAYGESLSASFKALIQESYDSGEFLHHLAEIDIDNDTEALCNFLRTSKSTYLFPKLNNQRPKMIFWDSFDNLDKGLQEFSAVLIKQMSSNDDNIVFVISSVSRPNNPLYPYSQNRFTLDISTEDVKRLLNIDLERNAIQNIFPNIGFILMFKDFLNKYDLDILNKHEFKLHHKLFVKSGAIPIFLREKWESMTDDISRILNRIYYSYAGIPYSECSDEIKDAIDHLVHQKLVKLDAEQYAIPFHHHYHRAYKNHFSFDSASCEMLPVDNKYEMMRIQIISANETNIDRYIEEIYTLMHQHQYNAIFYILEEIEDYRELLKLEIGVDRFLHLRYLRIYADANIRATDISAYTQFQNLCDEWEQCALNSYNMPLQCYNIYEISNSAYDNLDYYKCEEYSCKLQNLVETGFRLGLDTKQEAVVYCTEQVEYMSILSASELGKPLPSDIQSGEGSYRLLRSRVVIKNEVQAFISRAKASLTEACLRENYKHYIKADFDVAYLETMLDFKNTKDWHTVLNEKKNRFQQNNEGYFLKATYAIISLLLVAQAYKEAGKYNDNMNYSWSENPRIKGFGLSIEAAIAVTEQNRELALSLYQKQLQQFADIETYRKVVEHNIDLLQSNRNAEKFDFYFEDCSATPNHILLDPRCFY